MTKLKTETIIFESIIGNKYKFQIYPIDTQFKSIGGVYFFTKRYINQNGKYIHKPIYVGETGNLADRFTNHHRMPCIKLNNANCICVLAESSLTKRKAIENGLRQNYDPCCNKQ